MLSIKNVTLLDVLLFVLFFQLPNPDPLFPKGAPIFYVPFQKGSVCGPKVWCIPHNNSRRRGGGFGRWKKVPCRATSICHRRHSVSQEKRKSPSSLLQKRKFASLAHAHLASPNDGNKLLEPHTPTHCLAEFQGHHGVGGSHLIHE